MDALRTSGHTGGDTSAMTRHDKAMYLVAEVRRLRWKHDEFQLLIAALAENARTQRDADMTVVEGHLQEAFEAMDSVYAIDRRDAA